MSSSDWTPVRAIGTFTRRSGDGLLIETYHDGYEVNASGAFIWSRIGSGATAAGIAVAVQEKFGVPAPVAQKSVDEFLALLRERGFVIVGGPHQLDAV